MSLLFLLYPAQYSFQHWHSPKPGKGYSVSYTGHRRLQQQVRFGTTVTLLAAVCINVVIGVIYSGSRPVYAATCNISADTTVDQTYIDNNTCGDVHITSSAIITFSGAINLLGSSVFYVDSGVTATFSGAMSLSDSNDSVVIDGTVTHAATNTTGVSITAQTVTVSSTGSINTNAKGCAGGASSGGDGNGPNTSTGVCAITTAGYGDGDANGAAGGGHGGAGGRAATTLTGATYGSNTAPILLGSGGGAGGVNVGGAGGGIVRLDVAGTLTVSGAISASGGDGTASSGTSRASGGGSGGSIYITTGTLAGTSTMTTTGGNGGNGSTYDGGGGGGGRVAVYYDTLTTFTLANITATKGTKGGAGDNNGADGSNGSTFILDRKTDDGVGTLTITSGLDFVDGGDYARATISVSSGANLTCGTFSALNLTTTGTLTFSGVTWTCATVDTINITAATWTTSGTNTLTLNKSGGVVNLSITNDWTLNTTTITGGTGGTATSGGVINLTNAINVSLVSSTINSNISWTGLTSLNIDSGSLINANALGCSKGTATGTNGYGPDTGTGVCAVSTSGYGDSSGTSGAGGSHGGGGGRANDSFTGTTYGSNTAPVLLGSGGGAGNTSTGGFGGGKIRIDASGTVTINGVISANGANGATAASGTAGGGGSGGSVYITAGTVAGSSSITAGGGNGAHSSAATADGGGGGGGRIAIYYVTLDTFSVSNATATKGTKGGTATNAADGADGTVYSLQYTVADTPSITTPAAAATGQSRNIGLVSSAYASNGATHSTSDWQISDNDTFSNDCSDTNLVWCKLASSNKESVTVNSTNGTFQNALSGKTLLGANTTYYVRVRYNNVAGGSTWSSSVNFTTTTNTVPATPTNSAPADAATGVSKNPTLSASAFSDSNGDAHASSTWSVYEASDCSGTADWSKSSDTSNLTSIVLNSTNGTFADALAGRTTLKAHTAYSFKVVYTDDQGGTSIASSCTNFTTTNTAPALDSSIPTQTLTEDTNSTGAFDLDTYFSDVDFNDDDQYTCTASNGFSASLGTMTINSNRTVDFSMAANANGSDTIAFSCEDGGVSSTSSNTVTVNVTAVNDVPSFTKGSNQTVLEDAGAQTATTWATSISAGPSDESDQTLTFTVSNDNNSLFSSQPSVSTSTGNLTYTPAANVNGLATVTIYLSDNGGTANSGLDTSASQTFTITVTAVNDAPTANTGTFTTNEDTTYTGTLTGSDVEGSALTYSVVTNGTKGTTTVTNATTGAFSYVPTTNQNGADSFTFKVNDGTIDSSTATVTVTITAVNDTSTVTAGSFTTNEDTTYTGTLTGSDVDGNTLTYSVVTNGTKGTATITNATTGAFSYVPTTNQNGADSFTFKVNDGTVDSSTATMTVTITAVNDAPTANAGTDQTVAEEASPITLSGSGSSDGENSTLTYQWSETSDSATACGLSNSTSATPTLILSNKLASYQCIFSLVVNDGQLDSVADTVTITITADNDTPIANAGSDVVIAESDTTIASGSLDGSLSTDVESSTLTYAWVEVIDSADGCSLSNATTSQPTVTVENRDSNYSCTYQFYVNDGTTDSVADTVIVSVTVAANDLDTTTVTLSADDSAGNFSANDVNVDDLFTDNGNNTGTFAWQPDASDVGDYQLTLAAADSATTTTDIVTVAVTSSNQTPELITQPDDIAMQSGQTLTNLFDLDDYFSDPDGDSLTYTASGQRHITVTITAGEVSITAPDDFTGSDAIIFTATDSSSNALSTAAVVVTVSSANPSLDAVDHVTGSAHGAGVVTVVGDDGVTLAQWTAFDTGGVIPRLVSINDIGYVFAVKRTPGSTMRIFKLSGKTVVKQRLSPNLHWRRFDIGDLDHLTSTTEVATGIKRAGSVHFKIFRYRARTKHLVLYARAVYYHVGGDYAVSVEQGRVVLRNEQDEVLTRWKPTPTIGSAKIQLNER